MSNYTGILGICAIFLVGYGLSENRKMIAWRTVLGAFAMQVFFAFFVLYVPMGKMLLAKLADVVQIILDAGKAGVIFVFGPLAYNNTAFVFAFNVLAIIIFIASLVSVLYYLKIMPFIVNSLGLGLSKLLKSSKTESLSAAANIFLGPTEAPLIVKPFLTTMTRSQLFAVMTGGLTSVAGSSLAGYVALGVNLKYLLAAAFMTAPAGLLMAKLLIPETETTNEDITSLTIEEEAPANVIEAAAQGASIGMKLVLNIAAMLIAFIGLINLSNIILGAVGSCVGYPELSFNYIMGIIFGPIAFMLGVPSAEMQVVGNLLGQKLILNEFVAFTTLLQTGQHLSSHSQAIIIFALCGFSNIGSLGITIGGIKALAPSRTSLAAQLALKVVLASTLANLLSGAVVGLIL